jgi:hypothetical protein
MPRECVILVLCLTLGRATLRHSTGVCNVRLPIAVTRPSGKLSSRQQEAGHDRLSRGNLLWCSAKFGRNRATSQWCKTYFYLNVIFCDMTPCSLPLFKYSHMIQLLQTGFGLEIGFIEHLQIVTRSKDYVVTVLHTSQITIGHIRSSQSVTVFTSRCLVQASNGESSPSSLFPTISMSQLPVSNSNSSQQLNPSCYLTVTHNLSCL